MRCLLVARSSGERIKTEIPNARSNEYRCRSAPIGRTMHPHTSGQQFPGPNLNPLEMAILRHRHSAVGAHPEAAAIPQTTGPGWVAANQSTRFGLLVDCD